LVIKGSCNTAKINVIGKIAKTLKLTQNSVDCVRHTISFKRARKIKKLDHLIVSFCHVLSCKTKALLIAILKNNLLNFSPTKRIEAKIKLISVGLNLIKKSSFKKIVKLPNIIKKAPVTIGIQGIFLSMYHAIGIITIETMIK
jgi:hypothetical protein